MEGHGVGVSLTWQPPPVVENIQSDQSLAWVATYQFPVAIDSQGSRRRLARTSPRRPSLGKGGRSSKAGRGGNSSGKGVARASAWDVEQDEEMELAVAKCVQMAKGVCV